MEKCGVGHVLVLGAVFALSCGEEPEENSAPTVSLVRPSGGEFAFHETVAWRARDTDPGDEVTIDLTLERLDGDGAIVESTSIAEGLANTVGVDDTTYEWQRDTIPSADESGEPIAYQVRITAVDSAGNASTDVSEEPVFLVGEEAFVDLDWSDVGPIFSRYCKRCHGEPAATEGIDFFRLDKYNSEDEAAPINDDLGVFEVREQVAFELLQNRTMPPLGNSAPSEADRLRIERWFADGAPLEASE